MFISIASLAQDNPDPSYFTLKPSSGVIKIYQSKKVGGHVVDTPDLSKSNFWNTAKGYNYHFKTDITVTAPDHKKYIRITIPAANRWDPVHKHTVYESDTLANYDNPVSWEKNGDNIDSQDFNSWLWISETDLALKQPYYPSFTGRYVFAAITTPLKYRFSVGDHASSILNSDVNLGTFLGYRVLNHPGNVGLSGGVFFGISSLAMSKSNNDNSTLTATSSVSNTGLNYGLAAVVDVDKKFQVGLVGGWDHAVGDLSKGYIYQDRMWLGFSLNFKFLDFGTTGKDTQNGKADDASKK